MQVKKVLELPMSLKLVYFEPYYDERGWFSEYYNREELREILGVEFEPVQVNISYSKKNVLRGLHYQKHPYVQAKLVYVLNGTIYDVVVDVRQDSKTFGKWYSVVLTSRDPALLYIPEGFAHGFAVLSEEATVMYLVNEFYNKEHDRGIRWDDPEINIKWPIKNPVLSEKDRKLPTLREAKAKGDLL